MTDFLSIAHALADLARPIALHYFRSASLSVEHKDDKTPVTMADKEIEHSLRTYLAKHRPEDGIVGEEEGPTNPDAAYQWIIDPLDGTKAFTVGRPNFGCLIALAHRTHGIQLGLCDIPVLQDRWWSEKGGASYWNDRVIETRKNVAIDNAVFSSTDPLRVPETVFALIKNIRSRARIAVYGGDCMNFGLLASGLIDILIDSRQQIHDVAPFVPIIENAGGVITQLNGKPIGFDMDDRIVACASPHLHEEVLTLYRRIKE